MGRSRIARQGEESITPNMRFDVVLVPDFPINLLSAGKITELN
jgi:hypothetical protein